MLPLPGGQRAAGPAAAGGLRRSEHCTRRARHAECMHHARAICQAIATHERCGRHARAGSAAVALAQCWLLLLLVLPGTELNPPGKRDAGRERAQNTSSRFETAL